jgi:hypothetical protein
MSLDLNTARKLVSSITRAGNDGSWRKADVGQSTDVAQVLTAD